MPYLGNNPTANFSSVTKDTFSGNGSATAFTLSKVATTNGAAVYVENVRQIPTTAYAISGTTLTFTAAPVSGTNNIYVMHHNTPVSTATHPSTQALNATSVQTTGAGGLHATHGTTGSNVASFINTTANSNSNGVLHVKQTGATNQPTMVIEQTGEGGNGGDKQGLLIKNAGQNQGDGRIFRIETTNSNIASGNTISPLTVWNGGFVAIENKNNETSWQVNYDGLVQEVQIPVAQNSMNISGINQTVSGSANYVVTGLNSSYFNSNSLNNSTFFDNSNSKFTVPSGQLSAHYFVHFQTLLGITLPSSGNHYGYLGLRMNGVNGAGIPVASYRQVNASTDTSTISWETMAVSGVVRLDATDYIEPIFSGSDVSIRIHSGTYTSFSVVKIG